MTKFNSSVALNVMLVEFKLVLFVILNIELYQMDIEKKNPQSIVNKTKKMKIHTFPSLISIVV